MERCSGTGGEAGRFAGGEVLGGWSGACPVAGLSVVTEASRVVSLATLAAHGAPGEAEGGGHSNVGRVRPTKARCQRC
jgi:hypothetical protein